MTLTIREDRSAGELRAYARRAPDPRAAARAYAIANALEGMTRAEAARLAGLEPQSGSSGKPCAMPWCATTPRIWRGCTTGPSQVARQV